MSEVLQRLRKLVEAATPEPWHVDPMMGLVATEDGAVVAKSSDYPRGNDAALIATMRNAIPLLLDLVEAADEMRSFGTVEELDNGEQQATKEAQDYDLKRAALERAGGT